MTSTRLAYSGFSETRVWVECLVSWAHETWSRSLLFKDIRKYARTVKQNAWNEAENGERDWEETQTVSAQHFAWLCFLRLANIKGLFIPPPPSPPPTIKHATGVTDNKKYSSRDNHWLSTPGDTPSILVYTGRFRPKGVSFSGLRHIKG